MNDLEAILDLWHALKAEGKAYVLATIVGVEGSSYRRPGTCMLLSEDGRRAGTVSGGCLEAEVARRAWWLTESGPTLERYSTLADEGELPYGSGCGGVVQLLLERAATGEAFLQAVADAFADRAPLGCATVLEGVHAGERAFAQADGRLEGEPSLRQAAADSLAAATRFPVSVELDGTVTQAWACGHAGRTGIWIFSAGDDAKPLAEMARALGWWVAVADGRAHLATAARFPMAHRVRPLPIAQLPAAAATHLAFRQGDAAIVMTHSFEQDARILASILASETRPGYIGVLGPQRRTRELLAEAARLNGGQPDDRWIDAQLDGLYAPTGLDLDADTPAAIALSILAEAQKVLRGGSAEPLRRVRAALQETVQGS